MEPERDRVDALPIPILERILNPWSRPSFGTIATEGEGVLEAFAALGGRILDGLTQEYCQCTFADRLGPGC